MAPQSALIFGLSTKLGKTSLHVLATRIWEAFSREPKKLLNTKVIFIDEEASQIMLTVWNNQKQDYFPLLRDGVVYNISNFKVVQSQKAYRFINTELSLTFDHRTKVQPAEDTSRIPYFKFDLTKFEDIPPLLWNTKNFIDVIGMVKSYGEPLLASNGAKKLEILIVDNM